MAGVKIAAAASGGSAEIAGPPSSSANTVLKLPSDTGSAGQVLKVKSANHSATNAELEWAADAGGKILQVLSVHQAGVDSSTSTSWADTANMTLNITPATGSKVLIMFCGCLGHTDNTGMKFRIARVKSGTTTYHGVATSSEMSMISYTGSSDPTNQIYHQSFHHVDATPGGDGSTAITYKLQWKIDSGTIYLGRDDTGSIAQYAGANEWTLMEVGA